MVFESKFKHPAITIKSACVFGKVENDVKTCPGINISFQDEVSLADKGQQWNGLPFLIDEAK